MEQVITDINQLDPDGRYSYADYLKWQLEEYVELFRGKVMRMSPAPRTQHQQLAGRIFSDIHQYLRRKPCQVFIAPFDVRLPKKGSDNNAVYTVVQPDICIICDPKKLDEKGCVGAPDTIIEILSPGNFNRDVIEKFNLYEEHGIPEYWIVAPGLKSITTYRLSAEDRYESAGEYAEPGGIPVHSLPEFTLKWEDIFEDYFA